jgi:hypothetical protein
LKGHNFNRAEEELRITGLKPLRQSNLSKEGKEQWQKTSAK